MTARRRILLAQPPAAPQKRRFEYSAALDTAQLGPVAAQPGVWELAQLPGATFGATPAGVPCLLLPQEESGCLNLLPPFQSENAALELEYGIDSAASSNTLLAVLALPGAESTLVFGLGRYQLKSVMLFSFYAPLETSFSAQVYRAGIIANSENKRTIRMERRGADIRFFDQGELLFASDGSGTSSSIPQLTQNSALEALWPPLSPAQPGYTGYSGKPCIAKGGMALRLHRLLFEEL